MKDKKSSTHALRKPIYEGSPMGGSPLLFGDEVASALYRLTTLMICIFQATQNEKAVAKKNSSPGL